MNSPKNTQTKNRKIKSSNEINDELDRLKSEIDLKDKEDENTNEKKIKRNKGGFEKLGDKFFEILSWVETKLFALFCVLLAGFTIYYSNFFTVIFINEKVDQMYFYISILFYSVALAIFIYLSYYLPYFKNIHDDKWDEYTPNSIPIATIFIIFGMIFIIISTWNVWGFYSIFIILIMQLGLLMTVHFVPGGEIGSIIFFVILLGALFSGRYIEHEGHMH